jgi:hypothetical protein
LEITLLISAGSMSAVYLGGLDERGMKGSISFMIYGDRLGVLEIELILGV